MLDVVDVDPKDVQRVVQQVADSLDGRRVVVLHEPALPPAQLDGLDAELVAHSGNRDELAARFGPTRWLRVLSLDEPRLVVASVQPPEAPRPDESSEPDQVPKGPVFVGGTGRSGTWAVGRLLGRHPHWITVHTELRFHAAPPGFASVLTGEKSPEEFAEIVQRKWFHLTGGTGNPKGLQLILAHHELRRALQRFVARAQDDLPAALGRLMLDAVGPYTRGRGALGFTETTPDNAVSADALTTALPDCRVVHVVRDGRDVASSVAGMAWGPNSPKSGLDWWADRIRRVDRAMRAADPERVHTVRLEELIALDREAAFHGLLAFAGFGEHGDLRKYFDGQMGASQANVGRWRNGMSSGERTRFDESYRRVLADLAAEGVSCLPTAPELVDELAG